MTTLLSNEEKAGIINQHLKNLQYNKFNLEISVVEENALVCVGVLTVVVLAGWVPET